MILTDKSKKRLEGVHPDLVAVVNKAAELSSVDAFVVTEGLRTIERQKILFDKGASKTMKSRHITGHAVDIAALIDGEIRWDWPLYDKLAELMKQAANVVGVPIEWGGDWVSFKDGPHFQLPYSSYPG